MQALFDRALGKEGDDIVQRFAQIEGVELDEPAAPLLKVVENGDAKKL